MDASTLLFMRHDFQLGIKSFLKIRYPTENQIRLVYITKNLIP